MKRFLDIKFVRTILATLIVGGALLCVFTPDLFVFKRGANFTVQIMLIYLILGMFFMVLDRRKLVFVALGSSAFLCLYLKGLSDQSIRFPLQNTSAQISVAHINLSLSDDYAETMHTILSTDVDVISFQEYTPDWHDYLTDRLSGRYLYTNNLIRIDPYGMAIFSKYPINDVDTFSFGQIPNLHATIDVGSNACFHLVSAHTVAPVNFEAYATIRAHFGQISHYLSNLNGPIITLGDFNLPPWSQEVKEFKNFSKLLDSRRDIVPASIQGSISLLKIPVDHIFYSSEIECTAFQVITSHTSSHLGILGRYQMKEFASLE